MTNGRGHSGCTRAATTNSPGGGWVARLDRSERAFNGDQTDKGGAFTLTYWPSEFSQVRGEYRRTRYADDVTANEFLFQFLFAIGAHGAHVF